MPFWEITIHSQNHWVVCIITIENYGLLSEHYGTRKHIVWTQRRVLKLPRHRPLRFKGLSIGMIFFYLHIFRRVHLVTRSAY
jgi:hypothetical protein